MYEDFYPNTSRDLDAFHYLSRSRELFDFPYGMQEVRNNYFSSESPDIE
jgi:hypothetical protein